VRTEKIEAFNLQTLSCLNPVAFTNTWDRCYDFLNVFAENIGEKIVQNSPKLQKIVIITKTPVRIRQQRNKKLIFSVVPRRGQQRGGFTGRSAGSPVFSSGKDLVYCSSSTPE
jgi:hypothetical protein